MKLGAVLVLLTACAGPASLPWVQIDRSLRGPVCSREAAETIAQRRALERAEWHKELINCQEQTKLAQERERSAAWWRDNAPWIIVGAALASFGAGVAIGSQVR